MKLQFNRCYAILIGVFILAACKKNDEVQVLKNDMLKKTTSPAIAGEQVEFVYALGTLEGKLQSASAEASIAGATGTGFSRYSWYTNRNSGVDVPVLTVKDSSTNGALSTASLVDTNAVSLRYFYVVPAAAKGQTVSFKFSGTSTNGKQVSYQSPSYQISKMDMKRTVALTDGAKAYFSIADMAAYTKAEVEQNNLSAKISFVYIYRATMGSGNYPFGHALVSLNNTQYINDLAIPGSWTKSSTLIDKRIDVRDGQLKNDPNINQYVDDPDLQNTTFTNAANYSYGLVADQGTFIKTNDGFTAYVYVNSVNNTTKTMTISVKRLKQ